jgi:hypothetical protein
MLRLREVDSDLFEQGEPEIQISKIPLREMYAPIDLP